MPNCPKRQCYADKDEHGMPRCAHCIRCGKHVFHGGVHICVSGNINK